MPMIHVQRLSVVVGLILVCASSVPPPNNNAVASPHNGCIGRHEHGVLGVSQPFFTPLRQECFLGTTYYGLGRDMQVFLYLWASKVWKHPTLGAQKCVNSMNYSSFMKHW